MHFNYNENTVICYWRVFFNEISHWSSNMYNLHLTWLSYTAFLPQQLEYSTQRTLVFGLRNTWPRVPSIYRAISCSLPRSQLSPVPWNCAGSIPEKYLPVRYRFKFRLHDRWLMCYFYFGTNDLTLSTILIIIFLFIEGPIVQINCFAHLTYIKKLGLTSPK